MANILSVHIDGSLNPKSIPELAVGEFLHFYKYAEAFIASDGEVNRSATRLHLTIQPQAGILAVAVQYAEQKQLHIWLRYSTRSSCPECAPATLVFRPVTELADYVVYES